MRFFWISPARIKRSRVPTDLGSLLVFIIYDKGQSGNPVCPFLFPYLANVFFTQLNPAIFKKDKLFGWIMMDLDIADSPEFLPAEKYGHFPTNFF